MTEDTEEDNGETSYWVGRKGMKLAILYGAET